MAGFGYCFDIFYDACKNMNSVVNKVIISAGREVGGLNAFAQGLAEGMRSLNIAVEVKSARDIFTSWRELRDPSVLKILSTTAVFAAPFARNSICVAHGFPRADAQGWIKLITIIISFKLANRFSRLVTVSNYVAVHLRSIFSLRVDAVIGNALNPIFSAPSKADTNDRAYITFVGRIHSVKNIHRLIPVLRQFIDVHPTYRICVIGDGGMRADLKRTYESDARVEFRHSLNSIEVRYWLRRTKVFISGCETEAFGIAYLEALSQSCAVVMPASGGGMEIVPELLGSKVFIFPLTFNPDGIMSALDQALLANTDRCDLSAFQGKAVASAYLNLGDQVTPGSAESVE
jgi:glycosyltransferase involved in cell wall biosynthesis